MTTRHILIVDDEPKVAFFLSKALERTSPDYIVSTTHSGEEAIEMLTDASVDLLVTDLRIPGITGLELIKWVRTSSPQTRTILITAYGDDEVEAEARRLEAYRYITKPFDMKDFTQVVQEALRDVAISRPGFTVLSDEIFEAITHKLDELRREAGARCVFLADMMSQCLASVGVTEGLDDAGLLSLLGGSLAARAELAHRFGSSQEINPNFHGGTRHEIYWANVGQDFFIVAVYDLQVQASRMGVVRLYMRRTIKDLLSILASADVATPTRALDPDFGSSLMTKLDALLAEGPGDDPTPQGGHNGTRGPNESLPVEPDRSAPAASPPGDGRPGEQGGQGGPEQALLDMESAIAQGLVPPNLGAELSVE